MIVVAFLVVYMVAVAGAAWGVSRLVPRRWPWRRRALAVSAGVAIAVACLPVPIHGGFILLGPEVVRETWAEYRRSRAVAAEAQRETRADTRFAGWLPADAIGDGWRDPATGLVWSPAIWQTPVVGPDALAEGQQRCAARAPAGYWALPRNAEFFWLARTDRAAGVWLADAFLWPEGLSVAARLGLQAAATSTGADAGQRLAPDATDVRCVAVTPPAPVRGYRSGDIPLAEWNAFQVRLVAGGLR